MQYHALVVHETQRHTVARRIASAHECHMMVLHETRLLYLFLPISIVSLVDEHEPCVLEHAAIGIGREHIQVLVHTVDAETGIVTHTRSTLHALLGGHFNHTRCTTAAILRRLGSIFHDGETLDIGRIDAR